MTQWWELAIPAVATLTGGWVGAWWQGRSSEKQRHRQDERDDKQFFMAERRTAYVRFMELTTDLMEAAKECGQFHLSIRQNHEDWFDAEYSPTRNSALILNKIGAKHKDISALLRELRQRSLGISLIAPKEVASAASAVVDSFNVKEHPSDVKTVTHEDGSVEISGPIEFEVWYASGNLTVETIRLLQDHSCVEICHPIYSIHVAFLVAPFWEAAKKDVGLAAS